MIIVGIVVARGGEDRNARVLVAQIVEEALLVLPILSFQVGEVPQSQGEVPVPAGEVEEGISDPLSLVIAPPAVADGPDPDRILGKGPALGKGREGVVPVARNGDLSGSNLDPGLVRSLGPDGVVVGGGWCVGAWPEWLEWCGW